MSDSFDSPGLCSSPGRFSIDRDDFDSIPVLSRFGGWGAANRAFNDALDPFLREPNEAMAA